MTSINVTSTGRAFTGRAAQVAHRLREKHPEMHPVWHPLDMRYLRRLHANVATWSIRSSRIVTHGVHYINSVDVTFGDQGGPKPRQASRTAAWDPIFALSSHAGMDVGGPLSVFGSAVPRSRIASGFETAPGHQRTMWATLRDIRAEGLSLPHGDSCANASDSHYVPLDCVRYGHRLSESARVIHPPQILSHDGSLVPVEHVPLKLAKALHDTITATTPSTSSGAVSHDHMWFEVPAAFLEGDVDAFPFGIESDNVTTLDVSEFQVPSCVAITASHTLGYVIPLSSIVKEDRERAIWQHEYAGCHFMGGWLTGDVRRNAASLAAQEKYDSALWVSVKFVESNGMTPKCEELLGVPDERRNGTVMVNVDALEAHSPEKWTSMLKIATEMMMRRNVQREAMGHQTRDASTFYHL